ncbi:enoyl-CoA hydratase/isomerase family protein, partial [Planctomycetota bacterium]
MAEDLLKLETKNGIAFLTVNRPDKLNALNGELLAAFPGLLDEVAQDDSARALVITGAGDKAFVAGADIAELAELNDSTGKQFSEKGQAVFNRIENFAKPVIAAVNGFALGGGCELALSCHLRLCSPKAQFGLPEVSLGIIPGYAGTQRLSRIIGKGRAMEMTLTGDFV